ncbi:hypothetical protein Hdeb2414_s0006g00200781 [Helianthus debilis subsp. tardiflorus]
MRKDHRWLVEFRGRYRIVSVWEVSKHTIPDIRCITRFNGHRRVYEKWTRHWTNGYEDAFFRFVE